MDENFVFQPVLAEALPEVSRDGLTYTFKLQQGVKFHDGERVHLGGREVHLRLVHEPDQCRGQRQRLRRRRLGRGARPVHRRRHAQGARTPRSLGQVADTLHRPGRLPRRDRRGRLQGADRSAPAPSSSRSGDAAEYTEVEAFDEHFRGRPYLDAVRDERRARSRPCAPSGLETGEADSSVWPLVTEDNLRLAEDTELHDLRHVQSGGQPLPAQQQASAVLSDKRVRQAMMHAIDRQTMIDDDLPAARRRWRPRISRRRWSSSTTRTCTQYPYDPAQAAALLDEAGWVLGDGDVREKDGETLSFTCTDDHRRPDPPPGGRARPAVPGGGRHRHADRGSAGGDDPRAAARRRDGRLALQLDLRRRRRRSRTPTATLVPTAPTTSRTSATPASTSCWTWAAGARPGRSGPRSTTEIQAIVAEEVPFLFMMFWDWYTIFNPRFRGCRSPR